MIDFGKTEDRENDEQLKCFVAATRSKVNRLMIKYQISFLHGEHRKPEHTNRPPRKDRECVAPHVQTRAVVPPQQPLLPIDPQPIIP